MVYPVGVMQSPSPVEAKCTVCGHKRTFYSWDGESVDNENVNVAKNSAFIEGYCNTCGVNRVFQRI